MAFRVVRLRREARRNAKLEEIFQERDKAGNGTLDMEMVHDIFRIYEVDLDEAASSKYADAEGLVTKAEFVRLGQDYKLLDFTGGGIGKPPSTPRKKSKKTGEDDLEKVPPLLTPLLCCCPGHAAVSPTVDCRDNKVETAFRMFDVDQDGFLSWEEFQQMGKNTAMSQEQALRIFQGCDQTGRGKVSLEEFQEFANRKPPPQASA